jgi:hypothetical protein
MEILENKKKELEKRVAELSQKQTLLQQELNKTVTEIVRLQGAYMEIESIIKESKQDGPIDTKKPE